MERDRHARVRDVLEPYAIQVDVWLNRTHVLAEALRAGRATGRAQELESWLLVTYGMEKRTLEDFVAFDGTIDSVTDRMLTYFQQMASVLN